MTSDPLSRLLINVTIARSSRTRTAANLLNFDCKKYELISKLGELRKMRELRELRETRELVESYLILLLR